MKIADMKSTLLRFYSGLNIKHKRKIEVEYKEVLRSISNLQKRTAVRDIWRLYADHFNSVDRMNYTWYRIEWKHSVRDWEIHFCLSLMHVAMINAYAAFCEMLPPKRKKNGRFLPPITIKKFFAHLSDAIGELYLNNKNRRGFIVHKLKLNKKWMQVESFLKRNPFKNTTTSQKNTSQTN